MELIKWKPVERKRNRKISYTSPDFIRGYDIDGPDFADLVTKFNTNSLKGAEETRLGDYVLTMISIVLEHPKISCYSELEKESLTDDMFLAGWRSLKYVKPGVSPYSYLYRSIYMGAWRHFQDWMKDKRKAEAIEQHLAECADEYMAEIGAGKVPVAHNQDD